MSFTRRETLLGMAAVGGVIGSAHAAAAPLRNTAARSRIGRWSTSPSGLPVFEYTGPLPARALDKAGRDSQTPPDPMFILGNYRITAFPHVSGVIELMTGERHWARLNASTQRLNYADHRSVLKADGQSVELIGLQSAAADPAQCRRRFGPGFARFDYILKSGLACERIVSVKPSEQLNRGNPSLIIRMAIANPLSKAVEFSFLEEIANRYVPADLQQIPAAKRPVSYSSTVAVDASRNLATAATSVRETALVPVRARDENNPYDMEPAGAFMHVRTIEGVATVSVAESDAGALRARVEGRIPPRSTIVFDIVVGMQSSGAAEAWENVDDLYRSIGQGAGSEGLYAALWSGRLPALADEPSAVLKREMRWNAYVLEAMATYNRYFGETFIPQGQIYSYQDGENISNRDHLQALLPMCTLNPALAKSALRYVLKHTEDSGAIKRGNRGVGYSPAEFFKESDAQLYMFMGIGEYLGATGDYAFLDETVAYYPAEAGKRDTVLGMLTRHFVYLRDEVGTGPNGLIRILNSDWSDSFFNTLPINALRHTAESHMNSAMALAVMPNLLDQLRQAKRPGAAPLIDAMQQFHDTLSAAYLEDLGERDFSARAHMNGGKPTYGGDVVTIEAQGFLLQIPGLPAERKRRIYKRVKAALLDRVGFRIHERPIFGGKGEGEDGAIWRALEGQLIKGVISFDPQEGRRLLEHGSFENVGSAYPEYWLGQWTAFDGMQSSLSEREGLFNYWVPSIFTQAFTGFNSHPHAWPLHNFLLTRERGHRAFSAATR